ncbi:MAG TPA: molecular chaperone TorD family protein [Longimicrobiales bacterium]
MELIRALGELAEAPGPEQVRVARLLELPGEPTRAEYTELFVVQLYPYASVYLSPDGHLGGQVQEHIAAFWRVLREPVPRDPDHIATLFATHAQLIRRAADIAEPYMHELTLQMRHAFFWEHVASWMLPFLARVGELGSATYRGWGMLALDALEAEAGQVGPPAQLPLQLRNAPPLPASGGIDALVDALFSPVRCGCILTRADLSRCARDLGMNMRVAERRYTLRSLLGRDIARVSSWLANESRRQAEQMQSGPAVFGEIAEHWSQRAVMTADLLTRAVTHLEVQRRPQ